MPEGDTIHRVALRLDAALAGERITEASAPNPRSPLHDRGHELTGRILERAEARGKHLLVHFSGDLVLHSHLGMNGRWRVRADGGPPPPKPWLGLAWGRAFAAVSGRPQAPLPALRRAHPDPRAGG